MTNIDHLPICIDHDAGYRQYYPAADVRLRSAEQFHRAFRGYTEHQHRHLARETALLGIDPHRHTEKFVAAHIEFVNEIAVYLNEQLPDVIELVIHLTAEYFARGDADVYRELRQRFSRRLAATNTVGIYDNVAYNMTAGAVFEHMSRQIVVPIATVVESITTCKTEDEFTEHIVRVVLAHEVMHGLCTTATQENSQHAHWPVRSGLRLKFFDSPDVQSLGAETMGDWLHESVLEGFRRGLLCTNEVRYEPGVIVVGMLNDLEPGLRDRLMLGQVDIVGPGPLYGQIEELFGPFAIEELGAHIASVRSFDDYANFKRAVIGMLPTWLHLAARQSFYLHVGSIYECRDNYQEKLAAPCSA